MKVEMKALYLSVKDMDRAVKFYEEIFGTTVSNLDKQMSSFDFGSLAMLLFDPKANNEQVSYGNNVVPTIEVDDVESMFKLIQKKGCDIVMPLTRIGTYSLFQAKDTEGNVIEFYQNVE